MIKYSGGYVKDKKQASFVLLGFAVVAIIVSLFLIFGERSSKSEKPGIETFKDAPFEVIPKNK
ncbi:MAG: hypothetical protein KGJ58_00615 [Patescibacteria group bacterium]|nr:hypothetical protein [Patescibacteria group bacterium]MDE2217945.1 hypothetical protein [Patescibacteria group bacterium]